MFFRKFLLMMGLFFLLVSAQTKAETPAKIEIERLYYENLKVHSCHCYLPFLKRLKKHPFYLLKLVHFPQKGKMTLLVNRPLLEKKEKVYDFMIEQAPNQTIFISSATFLPGEKVEIMIEKEGQLLHEIVSFVPSPICIKEEDGTTLLTAETVFTTPHMDGFCIYLPNILEKEDIVMKSISGEEVIKSTINYSSQNGICLSPNVIGKSGGVCRVSFKRKNGQLIKVKIPWGNELHKYADPKYLFHPG